MASFHNNMDSSMGTRMFGSPDSEASSSSESGSHSHDGSAVEPILQAVANHAGSSTAASAAQQKPPKRKKGEKSTTIQTACVYCRGSKMKCIRSTELESCKRCLAAGIRCETKARRSGRKPGSGSKVAKAAALQKQQTSVESAQSFANIEPISNSLPTFWNSASNQDIGQNRLAEHSSHITVPTLPLVENGKSHESPSYASQMSYQSISDQAQSSVGGMGTSGASFFVNTAIPNAFLTSPPPNDPVIFPNRPAPASQAHLNASSFSNHFETSVQSASIHQLLSTNNGSVALHLNESSKDQPQSFTRSPLALLAAAGAADRPLFQGMRGQLDLVRPGPRSLVGHLVTHTNYFSDANAAQLLDYDHENDPIWRCIVSEEEAICLLDVFFKYLQPLVALFDARLHSFTHVRSRSTFLFTAMMASAAKFVTGFAAAAQRLDEHAKKLVAKVILDGNVSLDTVQGFCALCPWLDAGTHVALDTTSTYLSMAYDKFKRISNDFNRSSLHERLLARSYERTYLTLFNYDRGSALVMGEPLGFSIAERKDLVGAVWQWASSPEAIAEDWTLGAMVALRRDVPGILAAVTRQGSGLPSLSSTQPSPQIVRVVISEFLSSWQSHWIPKATNVAYLSIVGILITTLKEHVGQATETAVLQQALLAALQTLQAFVAPEQSLLTYLVNNTFVMIAYAAAFVLKVLVQWSDVGSAVETSIYVLLSQVERRLCDLGSHPPHRLGRSRIYGLQLGHVLRNQLQTRLPTRHPTPEPSANANKGSQVPDPASTMPAPGPSVGAMFVGEPSTSLSPFFKGELPGSNLDVAHMSVEEMAELLKTDYWLPLESNDFFDTSSFFSNVMDHPPSSL